jgi:hypothetical protein
MFCLKNHCHPLRLDPLGNGIGNLAGHPLLKLRALGHDFDYSGQFTGADDTPLMIGDIADMSQTIKGQQVMLAHRIEGDILEDYHFTVSLFKAYREYILGVRAQSLEELGIHLSDTTGGTDQALPLRVLSDSLNNGGYRCLDLI